MSESEKGGGGPYRESANPEAEALERMRKQIETEGKHGVLLTEDINEGDEIPQFTALFKEKIEPTEIILYSLTTGALEYDQAGSWTDVYTFKNKSSTVSFLLPISPGGMPVISIYKTPERY